MYYILIFINIAENKEGCATRQEDNEKETMKKSL